MTTNQKKVKLAIVGAGKVGTELLKIFLRMDSIVVNHIADIDLEAKGMLLAQEKGISTTTDITEVAKDDTLDLILEVTGSEEVLDALEDEKFTTTKLISGETSYLIFNMIQEYKSFEDDLLQTVVEHLEEIYTAIESDSQNVKNLLTEIKKITKNLNILAMNASIEAARAGKDGQGFSVVADEVKELSTESQEIVQEIQEINTDIIDLNEKISEVITDLE